MANNMKLLGPGENCMEDALEGIRLSYPGLDVYPSLGLVFDQRDRGERVVLLSGGGAGHEPFPAGFVGESFLSGSVTGQVFTSPPVSLILDAILHLANLGRGGVLVGILNYTGDQLNFGLAIEHAKANGIKVESVILSDDCALLGHETLSIVGRRGISGVVLELKILGGLTDMKLSQLVDVHKQIQPRLFSMGLCVEPSTLPYTGAPVFTLKKGEVAVGCGIHGEASAVVVTLKDPRQLVSEVLSRMLSEDFLSFGNDVCALIGNLGCLTQLEMFNISKEVDIQLHERGLVVKRTYVGPIMTSLNMQGFQVTLLNVTGKKEWLAALDVPTDAFGWPGTVLNLPAKDDFEPLHLRLSSSKPTDFSTTGRGLEDAEADVFREAVLSACEALIEAGPYINELDKEVGDGDCGTTLATLAQRILSQDDIVRWEDLPAALSYFARLAETEMGGTSGAVYSLLLQGATAVASRPEAPWHEIWTNSLQTLYKYTPARVGHRSLVDAFAPGCDAFKNHINAREGGNRWKEALRLAELAVQEGAKSTRNMTPKVGRAVYAQRKTSSMDAGAYGVFVWFSALASALLSDIPNPNRKPAWRYEKRKEQSDEQQTKPVKTS